LERNLDHGALGGIGGCADGLRHLTGLAVAETDPAGAVAHHHQSGEAEAAAALDHLGDAVDVDQLVHQVAVLLLAVATATAFAAATAFTATALTPVTAAATATAGGLGF